MGLLAEQMLVQMEPTQLLARLLQLVEVMVQAVLVATAGLAVLVVAQVDPKASISQLAVLQLLVKVTLEVMAYINLLTIMLALAVVEVLVLQELQEQLLQVRVV